LTVVRALVSRTLGWLFSEPDCSGGWTEFSLFHFDFLNSPDPAGHELLVPLPQFICTADVIDARIVVQSYHDRIVKAIKKRALNLALRGDESRSEFHHSSFRIGEDDQFSVVPDNRFDFVAVHPFVFGDEDMASTASLQYHFVWGSIVFLKTEVFVLESDEATAQQ
jgi:hypothetical protein